MSGQSTYTQDKVVVVTTEEFGRIEITDVPLPEVVQDASATYTSSGKVLVLHRSGEPDDRDHYELSIVNDDGSAFATIFSGRIPQHPKANGIRHMPFADNRRVLLGDYVLECEPDIDTCTSARLVGVEYPWGLEADPLTSHHWSEIIISPDNEHMAWTILRTDMGAAAAWGRLRRTDDRYVIDDPVLISSTEEFVPDPENEGCIRPVPVRGGEVKQFVRGGTAISAVGSAGGFLPDSVVQSLDSDEVRGITRTPGYDETTMFSPDERLGLVMTSRASAPTDPAVLGLVPRPHAGISGRGVSWAAYMYTVAGVRQFREGNIGPVLIDIERSAAQRDYAGVCLADPDGDWVYCSPMSWHPSGTKAMWMETLRGRTRPEAYRPMRVRVAHLIDHEPGEPVAVRPAPQAIPYAVKGDAAVQALRRPATGARSGRIAGRHCGHADVRLQPGDIATGAASSTSVRYENYSDDGLSFIDGTEDATASFASGTVYRADLALTGEQSGEMRLRMTWSGIADGTHLLFGEGEDGRPRSYGFARFGDVRADVDALSA